MVTADLICKVCDETFSELGAFLAHTVGCMQPSSSIFVCSICSIFTNKKFVINKHCQTAHDGRGTMQCHMSFGAAPAAAAVAAPTPPMPTLPMPTPPPPPPPSAKKKPTPRAAAKATPPPRRATASRGSSDSGGTGSGRKRQPAKRRRTVADTPPQQQQRDASPPAAQPPRIVQVKTEAVVAPQQQQNQTQRQQPQRQQQNRQHQNAESDERDVKLLPGAIIAPRRSRPAAAAAAAVGRRLQSRQASSQARQKIKKDLKEDEGDGDDDDSAADEDFEGDDVDVDAGVDDSDGEEKDEEDEEGDDEDAGSVMTGSGVSESSGTPSAAATVPSVGSAATAGPLGDAVAVRSLRLAGVAVAANVDGGGVAITMQLFGDRLQVDVGGGARCLLVPYRQPDCLLYCPDNGCLLLRLMLPDFARACEALGAEAAAVAAGDDVAKCRVFVCLAAPLPEQLRADLVDAVGARRAAGRLRSSFAIRDLLEVKPEWGQRLLDEAEGRLPQPQQQVDVE